MKRKLLSLLLALALVCSLVPAAWAAEGDAVTVKVVSELAESAFSLGPYEVVWSEGMTAWDAVSGALTANDVDYVAYGTYLSSVNGLEEYASPDYSVYYGWMYAVDNVVPAVGLGDTVLSGGEEILLYYATDFTIPGTVSGSAAAAEGMAFSAGELTWESAAGGSVATLTVVEGVKSVKLTNVSGEGTVQVNYADYDLAAPAPIPVTDGGVITVSVGDYPDTVYYNVNVDVVALDAYMAALASAYSGSTDSWAAIDLGAYDRATGSSVKAGVTALVGDAITAATAEPLNDGNLAKSYLSLMAMGVDPNTLFAADGSVVSVGEALMASSTTLVYNAPYVLMALMQYEGVTAEKLGAVLGVMESSAGEDFLYSYTWGGVTYPSPDTAGAVLAAVAPLAADEADPYGLRERASALRDGILSALAEDSLQNGDGSYGNSCTDAMVIIGLTAAGIDPAEDEGYCVEGGSAYTALLACAKRGGFALTADSAADAFSTEQGFRALCAMALFREGESVYDFSGVATAPGYADTAQGCPVTFALSPSGATVAVEDAMGETVAPFAAGRYSLAAGRYTYTVSAAGYETKTGTLTVTDGEAAAHSARRVAVSLAVASTGGGSISVTFTLVGDTAHDSTATHVYRLDKGAGRTWIARRSVTLSDGASAFDAFDKALTAGGYTYEENNGYIPAVTTPEGVTLAELDNGALSGWQYLVDGESPLVNCRQYRLSDGDKVVFYYTDDYTRETGSEAWGGGSAADAPDKDGEARFRDVAADAAYAEAVEALAAAGYMNGTAAETFSPDAPLTRAQAVTVLWRMAGSPAVTAASAFPDSQSWYETALAWAAEQGIAQGYGDGTFRGGQAASGEELRAFLRRWCDGKKLDEKKIDDALAALSEGMIRRGEAALVFQVLAEAVR